MNVGSSKCCLQENVYHFVYDTINDKTDRSEEEEAFLEESNKENGCEQVLHKKFHTVITGSHGNWVVEHLSQNPNLVKQPIAQNFIEALQTYQSSAPFSLEEQAEKVCNAFHSLASAYFTEEQWFSPLVDLSITPLHAALHEGDQSAWKIYGSAARQLDFDSKEIDKDSTSRKLEFVRDKRDGDNLIARNSERMNFSVKVVAAVALASFALFLVQNNA